MGSIFNDLTFYFALILLITTLGPFLFGFHLAELNAPQDVLTCVRKGITLTANESILPPCIPMTTFQFSVTSSIYTLGGLVGALGIGVIGGRHGRVRLMRYTTPFLTLGPVFEACAWNVATIALGRFISGIGAGASLVTVPLYVAEVAPPRQKGFFGSFTQVTINCGILVTQLLGYFLSRRQLWRIILAVGGVIGATQFIGLIFVVESPKWQADHGLAVEAKMSLQKIRGQRVDFQEEVNAWGIEDPEERAAEEEERLIHNDDQRTSRHRRASEGVKPTLRKETIGVFQVLFLPEYSRATVAIMMVMLAQQLCGINSIVMYGVSLLADLLQQSSALLNVCVAALNAGLAIACVPLPDRIGRKPCLLLSISGMGISSLLLAIAIKNSFRAMAAVTVLTFVGSFCLGLGPVPFILASELVGAEAVGATQSWALAANWGSTFLVAQFFPLLNKTLGKGNVFFVFTALAAFFAAFVAWYVPETKGKAEVDRLGEELRNE